MAITNFIPTIWTETLYHELDKKYIAVANSNREFEGDIKEKGASVRICGVGKINVSDYTKNQDMGAPQELGDMFEELVVDQAKYFNFQVDDIEKAQSSPKLMEEAMKKAASALANEADRYVLSQANNSGHLIRTTADVNNIINIIAKSRRKLYESNVSSDTDVFLEISPAVAELLFLAKADLGSDNFEVLENGSIGSIFGCKVFVSNNIQCDENSATSVTYKCMMRTKRSIAFAEQLSEIDAYRPEKRFADAIKGLYLYGTKVVYPSEVVLLDLTVSI